MTDKPQPESLRLADDLEASSHFPGNMRSCNNAAAAELRRQHARIAELEAELEAIGAGGVSGPLMGRAALSANAGEPVAWQYRSLRDNGAWFDCTKERFEMRCTQPEIWETRALYAAPPTAQAEGWTKLPWQLPEPGMPVLLDIGKKYPIRAMWAAKHTVQAADDDTDWGEYVEEDDMYYAPEGWYEWNQCEDNHWRVTETPRAWMPLPPTSAEGVGS